MRKTNLFLLQTMMRNQHQLELQTENKTEDTLNFREKYSVIA